MKLFMYSVFDSAAGFYERPFVARAEGEAIRSFKDIAGNAEHPIGAHPEHYKLFRLGTWDDNTGMVEVEASPVFVAAAHELVAEGRKIEKGSLLKSVNGMSDEDGEEIVNA